MDTIVGFVTELTGEKRGPKKNYRRFNVLTSEKESIQAWIFASMEIETTTAGNILIQSSNNNRPVSLHGKISTDESNQRTIKLYINNKNDTSIKWTNQNIIRPIDTSTTTTVKDALESSVGCRIEVFIIYEKTEYKYIQHGIEKRNKIYIIGDETTTRPATVQVQ